MGEAIPTHEKIVVLSVWLGISASRLLFGDAIKYEIAEAVLPEASISTPAFALINDILSWPQPAQLTIREIVDAFLKHYGNRE